MTTLSSLVAEILRDVNRADLSLTDTVISYVQSAVREHEAERFYFNERSLTITISATNQYALSLFVATDLTLSKIIALDTVTVLVNSSTRRYELRELGYHAMRRQYDLQPAQPTGNPTVYAIWQEKMFIDSYPGTAISGTIDAHVQFTQPVSLSYSSPWTNEAYDLIRYGAEKRLHGIRFKDRESAMVAQEAERLALDALRSKTSDLAGSEIEGEI